MNTPLTTAEIVERLTTDSDLLDAWATWELGALPVPGPMNHADIATNLRTAASALLALEGERDQRADWAKRWHDILETLATIHGLGILDADEFIPAFGRYIDGLKDDKRAAEAELAKVREALEPFGDIDGEGDEDFPDETPAVITFGRSKVYTVTLGDFRRARAALSEKTV